MSEELNPIAKEKIRVQIPRRELERRWSLVRGAMKEKGIDCLIMQNNNMWLGGYVRWFADIPAENGYPTSIIFPLEDEMTIINSGGPPLPPAPPMWAVYGVKEVVGAPYFLSLNYSTTLDAAEAVRIIKGYNVKTLGIVGKGFLSAAFYEYLKESLSGVDIVDATDLVDEIKAVKSEDELKWVKKAIEIQDKLWAAVPAILHPGQREYEVRSLLQHILVDLGSEEQLIMTGSAPQGQPSGQAPSFFQNRMVQPGDQLCIMTEVNGPGGFYGELGRTVSFGEPSQDLLDCWNLAKEAQHRAAAMLKPGANPADILKAHNEFMVQNGQPPEGRLFAHGQGYDLVERPAIRADEPMSLKENMILAVHPIASNDKAYAFCCDNYLVTKDGGILLHKTPQEIIVVDWV
jgi:Xaa-Pro aminopeptidase